MGRLSQLLGKELNTFMREAYPFVPGPQRQATLVLLDRVYTVLWLTSCGLLTSLDP